MIEPVNICVVGGGLAGLVAAARLARAGRAVTVIERRAALGGRAITHREEGFALNEGPHAVYLGGPAKSVLARLGVVLRGGKPTGAGGYALHGDTLHTLPAGPVSLLSTGLLDLGGKLEAARLLARVPKMDTARWTGKPFAEFLSTMIARPMVRAWVGTLATVSTYCADLDRMDAGMALRQLQLAVIDGVMYVDGGWGSIVDAVKRVAADAGVRFVHEAAVRIEHDGRVRGVRLASGETLGCEAALIASGPKIAASLSGAPSLARVAERAVPVRAACVDLAVRKMPFPQRHVAFGLGSERSAPLYYSQHSAYAKLAPGGSHVVHVMKYLREGERGDAVIGEIDAFFARLQPGADIAIRRVLPSMTVSHARVDAASGGLAGRVDVQVPEVAGLFVAGDWVGPEGVLLDAAIASADRAAERIEVLSSAVSEPSAA